MNHDDFMVKIGFKAGIEQYQPDDLLQQNINVGFTDIYVHYAGPDEIKFIQDYGKNVIQKIKKK